MMTQAYRYCPTCTNVLVSFGPKQLGRMKCPNCSFVFWNGPSLSVAVVLRIREEGVAKRLRFPLLDVRKPHAVLVQRGAKPYIGGWCLPCGFNDTEEAVEDAAKREVVEETGLFVRSISLLAIKKASYGRNTQIVFFAADIYGGELKAGDDAADVRIVTPKDVPPLCFPTHTEVLYKVWREGY